jgi:hypothetical protein
MSGQPEKESSRSAVILAIVAILVAVYAIMFGLQTLVWAKSKHWAGVNPWLLEVPKPLAAPAEAAGASKANAKIEPVKAYGLQFIPPWKGNVKAEPSQTATTFRFEGGQIVILFDPQTSEDTLREMETTNSGQYLKLLAIFGPKPFDSNYALYQSVYGATPAATSPFQDRATSLRMDQLLLMKMAFGVEAPGEIYSFELGNNRGLQFGDPAQRLPVAAHVFNERDEQFRLIIAVAAGSDAKVTQEDLDAVLSTVGHIPILMH